MIFSKALVLKVLGGLAVCTGVTVGGVKLFEGSGSKKQEKEKENDKKGNDQTDSPSGVTEGENSNPGSAGNPQAQTSSQTQQNSQKPGSEEGTDPGSSTGGKSLETQTPSKNSSNDCTKSKVRSGSSSPNQADQLIEKSHLKCDSKITNTNNGAFIGIIDGKTINVKWDNENKREGITSLTIPSGAKIKYEKNAGEVNVHNKLLKITIEGGDIELVGGTEGSQITKLEEFETYGIDEEGSGQDKKYYLSRKTNSSTGKSKALGLPKGCVLPEDGVEKTCTLTKEQLSDLNFEGKGSNQTTILESDDTKQSTLTIVKSTDPEFNTEGYKFTLKTEYTISFGSGSQKNKIISNTNTEFKIKVTTPTGGGAKILTLEKAWNLDSLASKVGITNCTTDSSDCNLPNTINVSNGEGDNTEGATISVASPKIKFLQEQPNHNQGFKFNTLSDIALSGGNPDANNKKIESSNNTTYEIKKIGDKWYLAKVTTGK